MTRTISSLGVESPGRAYLWSYEEGDVPAGHVQLETLYTGFSAGTELSFVKGTNPYLHARWDDANGVFVDGEPSASFPVPFLGYMESARVVGDGVPGLAPGTLVGATYGHKSGHVADPADELLVPVPDGVDPILAIYLAQMGPIAANGLLHADAEAFGPNVTRLGQSVEGRPVLVFGGGVVGLLLALFAANAGAAEVVVSDESAFRRERIAALGLTPMTEAQAAAHAKQRWHHGGTDRGADVVFQTRGHPSSLANALRALRPQGAVIDLAFYQGGADAVDLGREFHHGGLSIRCAQIGRVPRGLGSQWNRRRLSGETARLLQARGPDIRREMITHVVSMADAPRFIADLVRERPEFLQIVFSL